GLGRVVEPLPVGGDDSRWISTGGQTYDRELGTVRRTAVHAQERLARHERADAQSRHVGTDLVHRGEGCDADDAQRHRRGGRLAPGPGGGEELRLDDVADAGSDALEGVLA